MKDKFIVKWIGIGCGFILCLFLFNMISEYYFPIYDGCAERRLDELTINIPSPNEVNNFCRRKGFDKGWLSQSCMNKNEVQCHRAVGKFDEYSCIKWEDT